MVRWLYLISAWPHPLARTRQSLLDGLPGGGGSVLSDSDIVDCPGGGGASDFDVMYPTWTN